MDFKTFDQLTDDEKSKAITKQCNLILKDIVSFYPDGWYLISNDENFKLKLDKAWNESNEMKTVWFFHEYVWESCKTEIETLAVEELQNVLFKTEKEQIIPKYMDLC